METNTNRNQELDTLIARLVWQNSTPGVTVKYVAKQTGDALRKLDRYTEAVAYIKALHGPNATIQGHLVAEFFGPHPANKLHHTV